METGREVGMDGKSQRGTEERKIRELSERARDKERDRERDRTQGWEATEHETGRKRDGRGCHSAPAAAPATGE